jgi:hypothetical protein
LYEYCCRIFFIWFFSFFSKRFEYYRVLIYINLIILYFCKIDFFKIFLNNYRLNYIRYVTEGNFWAPFLSVNPSVIIFFYYQWTYRQKNNHRWKIHRQSIFISDFVTKLITNRIIIQILMKNSVDKFKDCDSMYLGINLLKVLN